MYHASIQTVSEVPYVTDTASEGFQFTVPLTKTNLNGIRIDGQPSLCLKIETNQKQQSGYFNLISDSCVSVNARYHGEHNVINQIAVRAVDNMGRCKNISVDLEGCSTSVDGVPLS